MSRQVLKDKNLKTIGFIEIDSAGKQTLKDSNYKVKGYYDPKTNDTKDSTFRLVGKGNLLATLL